MSSHAKRELPTSTANYILVVDAYSKWPACVPFRTFSYSSVIAEMERIFIDFGVPEVIISDNGSQFDCAEFRTFCEGRAIIGVFNLHNLSFSSKNSAQIHFCHLLLSLPKIIFPHFVQDLGPSRPRSRPTFISPISAHLGPDLKKKKFELYEKEFQHETLKMLSHPPLKYRAIF
jgi:hypothetical protein